jgi:hypothetical protein
VSELLSKYTGRNNEQSDVLVEPGASDDLVAFGFLRGQRDCALMLELRKKDGNILAVGYGWLERAEFEPLTGIVLHMAAGRTIRIRGRNLNAEIRSSIRLFEGITRHRVSYIQECGQADSMLANKSETVIESIEW